MLSKTPCVGPHAGALWQLRVETPGYPVSFYLRFLSSQKATPLKIKYMRSPAIDCSGLMELDTFMRDNIVNHRGVNNDPKTQLQAVPQGI
jgi:hypothetical protein